MTERAASAGGGMGPVERNESVAMERHALDRDASPPPAGYVIRPYASGDERAWTEIQAAADLYNTITPALFERVFGTDAAMHGARILFAADASGATVGTAAAWTGDDEWPAWGRIHWVAVLPAHQRHGVGRALVEAACERLRRLGHTRAYLTTSAARLDAIRLYDALGFAPRIASDDDVHTWHAIASAESARGTPLAHTPADA